MSDFKAKLHQIKCRLGPAQTRWGSLQRSTLQLTELTAQGENGLRGEGIRGWNTMRGDGREGDPEGLIHTSMYEILKNSLTAELIWLEGAATQTFALGGKYPRVATVLESRSEKKETKLCCVSST